MEEETEENDAKLFNDFLLRLKELIDKYDSKSLMPFNAQPLMRHLKGILHENSS